MNSYSFKKEILVFCLCYLHNGLVAKLDGWICVNLNCLIKKKILTSIQYIFNYTTQARSIVLTVWGWADSSTNLDKQKKILKEKKSTSQDHENPNPWGLGWEKGGGVA